MENMDDILKMATQIASSMSADEKQNLENMDLESMIKSVTQNVVSAMGPSPTIPQASSPPKRKMSNPKKIPQTRDLMFDLHVKLNDLYNGKKKKLSVKVKRTTEDNKVVDEKKQLIIEIQKGMKDEQKIVFKGEADQIPGYKPGDIIINIIEDDHPVFSRDGDNLFVMKNISLSEAYSCGILMKHIDNKVYKINKEEGDALHLHEGLRKITGLGMPVFNSKNERGDLFVRFNIVLPKTLDDDNIKKLSKIFPVEDNVETVEGETPSEFMCAVPTEEDMQNLEYDSEDDTDDYDDEEDEDYDEEDSEEEDEDYDDEDTDEDEDYDDEYTDEEGEDGLIIEEEEEDEEDEDDENNTVTVKK